MGWGYGAIGLSSSGIPGSADRREEEHMTAYDVPGLMKDEYVSRTDIGEITNSSTLIDYLTGAR
jgi:hypothetical protein